MDEKGITEVYTLGGIPQRRQNTGFGRRGGVVTETRNLVSVTTCRNIRQVRLEVNREVSPKFRGDAKILDLRSDSTIKESLIVAVDCEIPQSTFSSGISNRGGNGLFHPAFVLPRFWRIWLCRYP